MNNYSDKELLELFHKKDNRNYAFNLLVRKYQKQIYWHIRKIVINHDDTNDIVQNTFIKIWKNLDKFREDSKLYTWMYRIATNEAISFINKNRIKYFLSFTDFENHFANSFTDDNFFTGDEIQKKLQKVILKLPQKQRIVFNMRYFDEIKYKEMSEILNTSTGALKASYHIAVKKIKKYLTEN
jgi:RNA polymerase sigma-70 factor (ECF subfamily)